MTTRKLDSCPLKQAIIAKVEKVIEENNLNTSSYEIHIESNLLELGIHGYYLGEVLLELREDFAVDFHQHEISSMQNLSCIYRLLEVKVS